jgi:hypothetical protein
MKFKTKELSTERAKRIGNKGDMDMTKTTLTRKDILDLTGDGTFFSVEFTKRPKPLGKRALARGDAQPTEGEYRVYPTCRVGVKKYVTGVGKKFSDDDKNLVTVFVFKDGIKPNDRTKMTAETGGYRTIPCENVKVLKAHGKTCTVVDGTLVEQVDA